MKRAERRALLLSLKLSGWEPDEEEWDVFHKTEPYRGSCWCRYPPRRLLRMGLITKPVTFRPSCGRRYHQTGYAKMPCYRFQLTDAGRTVWRWLRREKRDA